MAPWHLYAALTVVTGSVASIILRILMKKDESDPIVFMVIFQLALTVFTFLFALVHGFRFPPSPETYFNFALGACLYAAGSLCNFYASRHIGAGELTILSASGSIISIILGIFLLSDSFGIVKFLGVILILLSILVLYGNDKFEVNRGFLYGLGVAFFYAVASINDIYIIRKYDAVSFIPLMSLMPGMVIACIFPKRVLKFKRHMNWTVVSHIAVFALFYAGSAITWYLALMKGAAISQLSPISRASIIVTVLLSVLFLDEKKNLKQKLLSALLVSVGVVLLG